MGEYMWLAPLGAFLVAAIGWLLRELHFRREAKRQAAHDASVILKDNKILLEDMISKSEDDNSKQALSAKLNEVNQALLGIYAERLRHSLKNASLPVQEILVMHGRSQLQTQKETLEEMLIVEKSFEPEPNRLEQLKEAIAEAEALPKETLDRGFLMLFSLAYYHVKQYQDAKRIYDEVLKVNPDDIVALTNRGVINLLMGNYHEALDDTNGALNLRPDKPEILHNRGKLYYYLKRYDEALADFSKSLQHSPNDPNVLNSRGGTYHCLKKYNEAIADYNRSLELKPDDTLVLNNRSVAYMLLGQNDKALIDLNRSLELNPNLYIALLNRGGLYQRWGMYDVAYADYIRALEIEPSNLTTHYNLSRLLSLQGKITDMLHYLNYLKKFVGKDKKYWQVVISHKDFDNIRDDPRFKKLTESD